MEQTIKFTDLARQQLLKELLDRRISDLDDWMSKCDAVWKEQHIILPYPKCPIYPSDDEVFARAKLLNEIQEQKNKKEIKEDVITKPMVEQPKEEVEIVKINTNNQETSIQNTKEIELETVRRKILTTF